MPIELQVVHGTIVTADPSGRTSSLTYEAGDFVPVEDHAEVARLILGGTCRLPEDASAGDLAFAEAALEQTHRALLATAEAVRERKRRVLAEAVRDPKRRAQLENSVEGLASPPQLGRCARALAAIRAEVQRRASPVV